MKLFGKCEVYIMKQKLQNTNINIRLPKRLKDKFVEKTKEQGLVYSIVLRDFIKNYIADEQEETNPLDMTVFS